VSTAYIVCRRCGYRIGTPFVCHCDAPLHFAVTCPKCGYRGVYSYADLIEQDKEACKESCKKASELKQRLGTYIGLSMLVDAIITVAVNIVQMLTTEEQKEGNKKQ